MTSNKKNGGMNAELARILARRRAQANRFTSNGSALPRPAPARPRNAPAPRFTQAQVNAFWRELQAQLNARRRLSG